MDGATAKKSPAVAHGFLESGILLVDKPAGPSSAQVVGRVKKRLGARKVGHLGTLDPFASGLLPLAINDGTKVAELFLSARKSYCGLIALGVRTDTQDATGRVVETRPAPALGEADLDELTRAFSGSQQQVPPMFSALKHGGTRLYHLARQGKEVPRAPRTINIESLRLWWEGPAELGFEMVCSKGTYVRTLAADIGARLGSGAHLKRLRRLACGSLTLDRAIPLDAIDTLVESGGRVPLLSLNEALADLPAVRFDNSRLAQLRVGQQQALVKLDPPAGEAHIVRVVGGGGLVALIEWTSKDEIARWRLYRLFNH
jgi:tRNA pseudouridine55 synthase